MSQAFEGFSGSFRRDESATGDDCVIVCPGGPLLVRGDVQIINPDGSQVPRTRPVMALCRCGKSGLAPLCDGSHKVIAGAS